MMPAATNGFHAWPFGEGSAPNLAARVWQKPTSLDGAGSHFGVVIDGKSTLSCAAGSFELCAGMYFVVPGEARLVGGRGLTIHTQAHRAQFMLGGPIEERGRLRYVNGCTDSLLIAPILRGDPCLNYLHLPAGSRQASHTHLSDRIGAVLSGSGICVTPQASHTLEPGSVFIIDAETEHCFHPDAEALRVVAFHPDSDVGSTHQDHPMLNRTIIDGLPARCRPELLTVEDEAP